MQTTVNQKKCPSHGIVSSFVILLILVSSLSFTGCSGVVQGNAAKSGTPPPATPPPPTVSITSPTNGATVSGTVSVSASASSSLGVASVQLLVDGGSLGSPVTAAPYTNSLDTTTLSNGNHTLAATAKDTAGTSATSTAITVTVSNIGTPPPPPPGGAIPSFQLSSPLGGTLPFTVGLGFKKGDVPSAASLSVPNSQVIVKSTWSDGSVKHAIASGFAALTANVPQTINVIAGAGAGGTNLTCTDIQTVAPTASVQLGTIGTVTLTSLLASPFRTWISGPQMVECHYRSAVGGDPTLVVWLYVRLYKGGRMWVRAVVENGYLDVSTADKSYVPTVTIAGTTVYNNGGTSLTHYAHTRWTVEGWIGGDPQITPKHDTLYLEATKLVPNYMNQTPSAAKLSSLTQTYTPMSQGDWTTAMGQTGFQNQIGLLPLWDALYVTSKADSRAYNSVLTNAKTINSYPIVWNDSATGQPPRPTDRPTYTVTGAGGGGATSWSAGSRSWDIAHHGSAGYVAYLITGDHYYLEDMEDQAAMCYLMNGSSNGSGTSRNITGVVQDRGVSWCMRSLSQLAALVPVGDSVGDDYRTWLTNAATQLNNLATTPGVNGLGFILSYEVGSHAYSSTASVLAPWQEHFFVQSMGMGSDIEPLSNMTTWNAVKDHLYLIPVGVLGPNGSTNYCFTEAAQYNLQVADLPTQPITAWYADWGTLWTKNQGSSNTSCGNTLHGLSGADPANASTGYWGNLMPTIAYAKDHGATGAAAAWTRLTGATNWSTVLNSGFGDTPMWGIVPRPPLTSVSVTAPTTGATVSQTVTVTASASNSAGIAGVQFQLDGANLGAEVTATPYSISWNTTTSANGTHFLAAVARDTLGNLTVSFSVNVTVSNASGTTPPVISAVNTAPSTSSAIITWTTDKPATSQVEYGTTTAYGSQSTLDSSLATSHGVTLGALSASTIYQFRVHSTDASGNTAVSVNFSFTTSVQSGGGIPSTLGWYQIPNTQLAPVCSTQPGIQGTGGCSQVIAAWSGAAADTKRNRLIIWGGGHNDYYGNEAYALDLSTLTMKLLIDAVPNPTTCVETEPNGTPNGRHTYDDLAYLPNVDKMFSFGGGLAGNCAIGSNATWLLDLAALTWHDQNPTTGGVTPDGAPGLAAVAYDQNTNLVFVDVPTSNYHLWKYDLSSNTYTQLSSSSGIDYHQTAVIDPSRKLLFLVGNGQFWKISIATGSTYAKTDIASSVTGCSAWINGIYPGSAFDTKQNLVVGWNGGNTVYQFDPDTNVCTAVTYTGGPSATPQPNGTNGRFAYFPSLNVFAIVNDYQQNAYTLRLTQ